ncbi:DUF2778 domain-containing protein [Paraburkholderia gardini]|uniref:DUF2778 domain-containing protein n=1 Tax=Paraburkholderia gardini TaxID=2823469 RepID=UPI001D83F9BB|nr:DUF2778 domain-containing protein [Paraburkholderia gardini]CAG4893377.1 hypothetical protein R69919_01639 [Paraburkholderia gardini]
MPIRCTFGLNSKTTSALHCSGFGTVTAYSGQKWGRDNPKAIAAQDVGPLPPGTYYIVDRQSGGMLGWARDLWSEYGYGTTDRTTWFALWNPTTGDTTMVNGIRRGNFRLHPEGPRRLSEGCITVVSHLEFDQLNRFIRSRKPTLQVPGSDMRAYGTVDVR